jgi:hypothetical protein
VVGVAAGVVAHRRLLVAEAGEVLEDLLHGLVRPLGSLQSGVRLVHVSLMVLVVMHAHRLLIDVRLQRAVVVGKVGYLVGHCSPFAMFARSRVHGGTG